jgi:hypothetical protein
MGGDVVAAHAASVAAREHRVGPGAGWGWSTGPNLAISASARADLVELRQRAGRLLRCHSVRYAGSGLSREPQINDADEILSAQGIGSTNTTGHQCGAKSLAMHANLIPAGVALDILRTKHRMISYRQTTAGEKAAVVEGGT